MQLAGKIGIGVGASLLVAGAVLYATGCGAKETDATDIAYKKFGGFDGNGDGVSRREAQWDTAKSITSRDTHLYYSGDYEYVDRQYFDTWTHHSMEKAFNAADTNRDAIASWTELTSLAQSFNRDDLPTLNRKEQKLFNDQYGPTTDYFQRPLNHETVRKVRTDYPPTNGGRGPTGPGDSGGYIPPGSGGPTGPGDSGSGGYIPPGNGNGPGTGDSPSAPTPTPAPRPTPAPSPGPGTGTGTGDTTSNGNPPTDAF